VRLAEELSCATSGTTLSLAHLATCALIVIKNTDTTNYVTVTFKTNAGTGTAYSMKLTAGQEAVFRDIYATGGAVANWTITANTSAVVCEVSYVGT
jgi:hypothetical protein